MDEKNISELAKIVDNATDAIEFKLVVASLIAMIGNKALYSMADLRDVLQNLIAELDTNITIKEARKKCKVAITTVSLALQYN